MIRFVNRVNCLTSKKEIITNQDYCYDPNFMRLRFSWGISLAEVFVHVSFIFSNLLSHLFRRSSNYKLQRGINWLIFSANFLERILSRLKATFNQSTLDVLSEELMHLSNCGLFPKRKEKQNAVVVCSLRVFVSKFKKRGKLPENSRRLFI